MVSQHNANRLINSTSPYLLQHAYNPVDWYEWSEEALLKAKAEDKPILVSIGYSSCHWCHVMEREAFEKENIAKVMNDFFVCIKVDREERPDVDQVYMDAIQALGIQGGWPLNVFLTPDQKPFFGGTYFSPQTWVQVLNNIHNAFETRRHDIEETAEQLSIHLKSAVVEQFKKPYQEVELLKHQEEAFQLLSSKFDTRWGGLDKTPKFVMPSIWLWLLRYFHLSKNEAALSQLTLTLKRVFMGGIYDQVGGGFARYSVDKYWFAPHFEKMLYDNAQLLSLYSEAYTITKEEEFKNVVYETFNWLQREMTSDNGGFYSALDADSEGIEGKYYVWTQKELENILGDKALLFTKYYSVKPKGNWENSNILMRNQSDEIFFQENNLTSAAWFETLKQCKKELLRERNKRISPGLDDKIITAWNAMMIIGLIDAYQAFNDNRFYKAAVFNMQFLENELMEGNILYRSFKEKHSVVKGFLDDYAYVIQAQIRLYQVSLDDYWIQRAENLMQYVMEHFYDSSDGFFYYTMDNTNQLIARKKEIFDNVVPSSNAVMAQNLNYLGILLDREEWKKAARDMTFSLSHLIHTEITFMSHWAITYSEIKKGLAEVVFVGNEALQLLNEFNRYYQPFTLKMGMKEKSILPLVKDKKEIGRKTTIFVCFNKTCKLPVHTVDNALKQLN